jgi:hypothetical protein
VPDGRGRTVPLAQIAELTYGFEQGVYWRRDRLPSITVRSDIRDGIQAPVVSQQVEQAIAPIRAKLPVGYRIDTGGAIEDSAKGQQSIAVVAPIMVLVMLTALMLQLQSFSRLAMVVLTAPLGLIGVSGRAPPLQRALRLRRDARHHRARRHDHEELRDPRGPDRPRHPRRKRSVGSNHRRHRAPLPTDHPHRRRRGARHDPARAQRLLRPHGGRHHGWPRGRTLLTLLFLPALYAPGSGRKRDRSRPSPRNRGQIPALEGA